MVEQLSAGMVLAPASRTRRGAQTGSRATPLITARRPRARSCGRPAGPVTGPPGVAFGDQLNHSASQAR